MFAPVRISQAPGLGLPPRGGSPFLVQTVQTTILICTYISICTSDRRIVIVLAGIFVCTFPENPVQTRCKGANVRGASGPIQKPLNTPAAIIPSCAPSSPAGPAAKGLARAPNTPATHSGGAQVCVMIPERDRRRHRVRLPAFIRARSSSQALG
jgi:hypothetical protein